MALGAILLGTGRSCIESFAGCDPSVAFRPGCHATIGVTFVLDFADRSVTAPMTLREAYPDTPRPSGSTTRVT